jgi:predicted Zn-dependent protease
MLFMACTLSFSGLAGAQSSPGSNDLPDIGSGADATLTLSDEYQIGRMIVRDLREQGQILDDPEVNDYLQAIGSRIAAQAQEGGQRFQFFLVKDPAINAFALPGGFIGINQGLFTATANEAQLASVLAHEIAHVTQRHIARSIRAQGRQSLASAAAILAAILIGATTGSPDMAQAGIAIAQGAAVQQRINFTRSNEYEADRIGISFLASAGFDPYAMSDFFSTIGRRAGLSGSVEVPEFLRTHPVTSNRIAESRDRAAQIPVAIRTESLSYALVRERARVVASPPDSDLRPYYAALAESRPLDTAQRYGQALARMRAGENDAAASTLVEISAGRPGVPMLESALGQALLAAGRSSDSMQVFERALAVAPRNVPLSLRQAEALLRLGKAREAHTLLLDLFNNVPPTPEQIRFTAFAASSAGDTGDAYYYMSEYHIGTGDLPLAVKQLELALEAPDLTSVQRARFEARQKEIREVLAQSGRRRDRRAADTM